jgi:diketogulonate reductase-like aldo/keto reductase
VLYHLGERAIEHGVIPWCEQHDVAVVAYSPFGHSGFTARNSKGGYVLADVAAAHGASLHQMALAFLTRKPSLFAIPKAARLLHVEENAKSADIKLSDADIARLEEAFPLGVKPRGLPMI